MRHSCDMTERDAARSSPGAPESNFAASLLTRRSRNAAIAWHRGDTTRRMRTADVVRLQENIETGTIGMERRRRVRHTGDHA